MAQHVLPTAYLNNHTGIAYGLGSWAFAVTGGWFWALVLFGLTIVLFIASTRFGTPRAFGFASFVGMTGAIMLAVLNFLSWGIASLFIVVGFIGMAVMIMNEH